MKEWHIIDHENGLMIKTIASCSATVFSNGPKFQDYPEEVIT
jgi:hypothetical protein